MSTAHDFRGGLLPKSLHSKSITILGLLTHYIMVKAKLFRRQLSQMRLNGGLAPKKKNGFIVTYGRHF